MQRLNNCSFITTVQTQCYQPAYEDEEEEEAYLKLYKQVNLRLR